MSYGPKQSWMLIALWVLLTTHSYAHAQHFVISESGRFVVGAKSGVMAHRLADEADQNFVSISEEWLGAVPPHEDVIAMIHYSESDKNRGTTWVRAHDKHIVFIESSERSAMPVLAHEVCHLVMLAEFGDTLPPWVMEGVACFYDEERDRVELLEFENPDESDLSVAQSARRIRPTDRKLYAASYKMVRREVEQHGKRAFLKQFETE